MIYNSYFILLLFKKISSNNYKVFFTHRIRAMIVIAWYLEELETLPVFKLKMEKAVKTLLGSNRGFCKN